jgi:hypothetical protein
MVGDAYGHFSRLNDELPFTDAESLRSLRVLLLRGQDLWADYEALYAASRAEWNSAAWAYAGYMVDLNYGDQVEVSSSGRKQIFHCCNLQMEGASDSSDPADLYITC